MAISERFTNETQDTIHERLLASVDDEIDKRQGAIVWDMTRPSALELAQAYVALDRVLTFGFASPDMPSRELDLRANEMGLTRKPATAAVGTVTFTGTNGITVEAGTRLSTDESDPIYFVTTQVGVISNGTLTVETVAELAGVNGNVAQGQIAIVLDNVSGVSSVTNSQAFDGGTDAESDESLLTRYFGRVRRPATSGNANHYEQWAKEVAGVGDAKVYPLANGPGTVKVVLLDVDKTAPPESVVNTAIAHIESVRPIGATVEVVGATETPINVSATLTLADGAELADAQAEFESLLRDYLKELAFVDPIVRYSQIASLLLDVTAVLDYANLVINGVTGNLTIQDGAVAVIGAVEFA
ncbi:baseplate J/gp47 family protein [Cytobacillus gottheilii]|uniref:Baseplate J/gp47 family protein n=1 Tax=Cytobacillus gottheilii TaxID=859144 RepID=A0ABX8FG67_9BACI|nr:baseplate J/gp47 family protein [Cytobacillus gottheilii]QVY62995.1 baseplate J/gp47 family protein [Cytobacillus gottheilii]